MGCAINTIEALTVEQDTSYVLCDGVSALCCGQDRARGLLVSRSRGLSSSGQNKEEHRIEVSDM